MQNENNELKSLATLAKQRLKKGNYTDVPKTKTNPKLQVNSYFIKNLSAMKKLSGNTEFVTITDEEDKDFVKRVYAILNEKNEVYNPIGRLVDENYYAKLNDVEKQFYILSLVDRFNKIKNEFEHKNEDSKIG